MAITRVIQQITVPTLRASENNQHLVNTMTCHPSGSALAGFLSRRELTKTSVFTLGVFYLSVGTLPAMKAYFDDHSYEYVTAGSPNMIGDTLIFIYQVSPSHGNWLGNLFP